MAAGEKKTILSLPLKIILTEEGSNFFIRQNKKLLKFKLADNVEEYGISLEQFTPSTVQRLLLIDYISKIEISKPEFVTSRQETMDLSKLIVYSVLYRQYDSYIFHQILNSDVIKKWNRLNPANIIDEKTHINENFLRSVLKKNEKIIFAAKQEILTPLYFHQQECLAPARGKKHPAAPERKIHEQSAAVHLVHHHQIPRCRRLRFHPADRPL